MGGCERGRDADERLAHHMQITPLVLSHDALIANSPGDIRAPGLHASDIYGSYYQESEPDRYKGDKPAPLLLGTGMAIEDMIEEWLARQFAAGKTHEQIQRPGEFIYHGTFEDRQFSCAYNPDLFIFNGSLRIGEIKGTWMSSHIDHQWLIDADTQMAHADDIKNALSEQKFDKYYTQIKLYCKFVGTPFARLYIFFIAGNYKRPYVSQLISANIEFTQDEIDFEYQTMMYHALSKGLLNA